MSVTYSFCESCQKVNRVALGNGKRPVCGACKSELPMHGAVTSVGAAGLSALLRKSPLPVIADFWAEWCGPCKAFAPTFEKAAAELAGKVVFVKVDTEAHQQASATYSIRSIPTLILFSDGAERARQSGALPHAAFVSWISQATSAAA